MTPGSDVSRLSTTAASAAARGLSIVVPVYNEAAGLAFKDGDDTREGGDVRFGTVKRGGKLSFERAGQFCELLLVVVANEERTGAEDFLCEMRIAEEIACAHLEEDGENIVRACAVFVRRLGEQFDARVALALSDS